MPSSLNQSSGRRSGFKVAYRRVSWIGRLVGIEPEVIQRAKANRVRVLILSKGFRAPGDRVCILHNSPRCAAITLIVERAVVWPAGFLTGGVKTDVRDVYSGSERHAEGLDGAVEVLVVQRVFIVPNAS